MLMRGRHYENLGISHNASRDKIKGAYRTLSKAHHPDKVMQLFIAKYRGEYGAKISAVASNPVPSAHPDCPESLVNEVKSIIDQATENYKILNQSYSILSDSNQREIYDAELRAAEEARRGREQKTNETKREAKRTSAPDPRYTPSSPPIFRTRSSEDEFRDGNIELKKGNRERATNYYRKITPSALNPVDRKQFYNNCERLFSPAEIAKLYFEEANNALRTRKDLQYIISCYKEVKAYLLSIEEQRLYYANYADTIKRYIDNIRLRNRERRYPVGGSEYKFIFRYGDYCPKSLTDTSDNHGLINKLKLEQAAKGIEYTDITHINQLLSEINRTYRSFETNDKELFLRLSFIAADKNFRQRNFTESERLLSYIYDNAVSLSSIPGGSSAFLRLYTQVLQQNSNPIRARELLKSYFFPSDPTFATLCRIANVIPFQRFQEIVNSYQSSRLFYRLFNVSGSTAIDRLRSLLETHTAARSEFISSEDIATAIRADSTSHSYRITLFTQGVGPKSNRTDRVIEDLRREFTR